MTSNERLPGTPSLTQSEEAAREPVSSAPGEGGAASGAAGETGAPADEGGSYLDKYLREENDGKGPGGAGGAEGGNAAALSPDDLDTSEDEIEENPYAHYEEEERRAEAAARGQAAAEADTTAEKAADDKKADDKAAKAEAGKEDDKKKKEKKEADEKKKKEEDEKKKKEEEKKKEKPKRPIPESNDHRIALNYPEGMQTSQYVFDAPDPQFYLGGAMIIGCASIFTFLYSFIQDHMDITDKYLYIVAFCGAFVIALVPFFYYVCTSRHYAIWGRLWDGIAGGFPVYVATAGILYIYTLCGMVFYYTIQKSTERSKFLVYGTVPFVFLTVLPTFLFMLKFQGTVADHYRSKEGLPTIDYTKTRISTSGCMYQGLMLRRVIVGWVVGVCLAAHMCLPFYGLSWCAYGLKLFGEDKGWWAVGLVVGFPVLALVILAIIRPTRIVPLTLLRIVIMYFYYPMQGWDPRHGSLWLRYDNSLTYERMVNGHNRNIDEAEKFYADFNDTQAQGQYMVAAQTRDVLRSEHVPHVDVLPDGSPFIAAPMGATNQNVDPPAAAEEEPPQQPAPAEENPIVANERGIRVPGEYSHLEEEEDDEDDSDVNN